MGLMYNDKKGEVNNMELEIQNVLNQYHDNIFEVKQFLSQMENTAFSYMKTISKDETMSFFPQETEKEYFLSHISEIIDQINNVIIKLCEEQEKINIPVVDSNVNPMTPTAEGDLLHYLINEIEKGVTDKESLFSSAITILEAMCITKGDLIHGEQFHFLYANHDRIRELIEIAFYYKIKYDYEQVERRVNAFTGTVNFLHLLDSRNHINLYKQSFIQVMAFFDSSVFQLFQVMLNNSFFEWAECFDNKTLKTHEIAKFSSFDEVKEYLIETLLKSCYVKDLLEILRKKDSTIFDRAGTEAFQKIREAINRRNVHIHHNGLADKQYVEAFNIYKQNEGDYLTIDVNYCNMVIDISTSVIEAITDSIE